MVNMNIFMLYDILFIYWQKTKIIKQHYLKKYANPKLYHPLVLPEIKTFGRQILEVKFKYSRYNF